MLAPKGFGRKSKGLRRKPKAESRKCCFTSSPRQEFRYLTGLDLIRIVNWTAIIIRTGIKKPDIVPSIANHQTGIGSAWVVHQSVQHRSGIINRNPFVGPASSTTLNIENCFNFQQNWVTLYPAACCYLQIGSSLTTKLVVLPAESGTKLHVPYFSKP